MLHKVELNHQDLLAAIKLYAQEISKSEVDKVTFHITATADGRGGEGGHQVTGATITFKEFESNSSPIRRYPKLAEMYYNK